MQNRALPERVWAELKDSHADPWSLRWPSKMVSVVQICMTSKISHWHLKLKNSDIFYSIFSSSSKACFQKWAQNLRSKRVSQGNTMKKGYNKCWSNDHFAKCGRRMNTTPKKTSVEHPKDQIDEDERDNCGFVENNEKIKLMLRRANQALFSKKGEMIKKTLLTHDRHWTKSVNF